MHRAVCLAFMMSALVQVFAVGGALSQTQPPAASPDLAPSVGQEATPADVPHLQLSEEQKHTIYVSVSSQNRRESAPPAFLPMVGAVIPVSIQLRPLP